MTYRTIDFVTELDAPQRVVQTGHALIYSTNLRDRFRVLVKRAGAPVSLADQTISGTVLRPDGQTVTSGFEIEKETDGTGYAAIVLPSEAYAYPGTVTVTIFSSDGLGHPLPLVSVQAQVLQVTTDTIVDPGETVPSVQELLAEIAACEAATEDARDVVDGVEGRITALESTTDTHTGQIETLAAQQQNTADMIASTFDASTNYSKGDFVIWNLYLFRFTADHPAGPWKGTNVSDVTDAVLAKVGEYLLTFADDGEGNITVS